MCVVVHQVRRGKQGRFFHSETVPARQKIEFSDKQGNILLALDEPLRPAEAYRRFLDAVPAWSGVTVVTQRRVKDA